jgi:hypothetical protein
MARKGHTEEEILRVLREAESGETMDALKWLCEAGSVSPHFLSNPDAHAIHSRRAYNRRS